MAEILLQWRTRMVHLVVGRVVVCLVCHVDGVRGYAWKEQEIWIDRKGMIAATTEGTCIYTSRKASNPRLHHIRKPRLVGLSTR
jgi:hypothetical protein